MYVESKCYTNTLKQFICPERSTSFLEELTYIENGTLKKQAKYKHEIHRY